MKRMLNQKKRPSVQKKGLKSHRRFFRTIRTSQKKTLRIESPHNTSQFLIENNSTPFFVENEEEDEIDCYPNPVLLLKEADNMQEEISLNLRKISSYSTQPDSFPLEEQNLHFESSYLF